MVTPELEKVLAILEEHFNFHAAILYGSRAVGEYRSDSDYDFLLIKNSGPRERKVFAVGDITLDVIVDNDVEVENAENYIYLYEALIIKDENGAGRTHVEKVKNMLSMPPEAMGTNRKEQRKKQTFDALKYARIDNTVGNYRRHWTLMTLLPIYFEINQLWYLGDKHALNWLKQNKPELFALFEEAFDPSATLNKIEKLALEVFKNV